MKKETAKLMIFLDRSSKLSDVILAYHQVIPLVGRFNIKLGVGDKTIEQVCDEYKINTDFFLTILNTFLNEDYFPEKKLKDFDINLVINYLAQADSYTLHVQLHNLEKHLNAFISTSDPNNKQLIFIGRVFEKFREELTSEIKKGMENGESPYTHLIDLKNIIVKHISGSFNENMHYAVIFSIDSIQKDMDQNNRIREKILKPMIKNLEEMGIDNWKELIDADIPPIRSDRAMDISQREFDVLRLVALGYMNKEIADSLSISLNTVLTHRKNITNKLGIKTVSGLIFYCISKGYISADEIEF